MILLPKTLTHVYRVPQKLLSPSKFVEILNATNQKKIAHLFEGVLSLKSIANVSTFTVHSLDRKASLDFISSLHEYISLKYLTHFNPHEEDSFNVC